MAFFKGLGGFRDGYIYPGGSRTIVTIVFEQLDVFLECSQENTSGRIRVLFDLNLFRTVQREDLRITEDSTQRPNPWNRWNCHSVCTYGYIRIYPDTPSMAYYIILQHITILVSFAE